LFFRLSQALVPLTALRSNIFAAGGDFDGAEANLVALSRESFQRLVKSNFAMRSGSQIRGWWLTLLSVDDLNSRVPGFTPAMHVAPKPSREAPPKLDTFALRFWGTEESLPSATYILEGGSIEPFALFVVPSGKYGYTAIFNRFIGNLGRPASQGRAAAGRTN
jgi:hypothetical protein